MGVSHAGGAPGPGGVGPEPGRSGRPYLAKSPSTRFSSLRTSARLKRSLSPSRASGPKMPLFGSVLSSRSKSDLFSSRKRAALRSCGDRLASLAMRSRSFFVSFPSFFPSSRSSWPKFASSTFSESA
ncbi:hypothetical protein ACLESO_26395 [Pyxidicoccus sp. 3LG]